MQLLKHYLVVRHETKGSTVFRGQIQPILEKINVISHYDARGGGGLGPY